MKKNIILSLFTIITIASAFAQGSLTPPGAPAQTMKSLDQVQPRTPIAFGGFGISVPGSYYLTTNLVGFVGAPGINIICDNVTIDLNGFILQGVPGSTSGIHITGSHTNIVVHNGIITGWGNNGIDWNYPSAPPQNVVLEHLSVSANGISGIVTANGYVVSNCTIENNINAGIFVFGDGSQILGNTLSGNNATFSANVFGILVEGSNNRIEDNHIVGSNAAGYGIQYNIGGFTNNIIIKNSVAGNGANNFSGGSGDDVGPIGTAATSTSPWANISH